MPTSRQSTSRRVLALWLAAMLPAAAFGQDRPAPDARSKAQAEGNAAMDAVRHAMGVARQQPVPSPALPPPADPATKRRAFEALSHRTRDPALAHRAEADVAAAQAGVAASREDASRRIAQALGLEAPAAAALAKAAPSPRPSSWVPVLLVSSSMPVEELRTYVGQLERVGGVLAFRGMPGGMTSIGPMAKLSAQILRVDPGCEGPACVMRDVQVIVDPIVFRQHGVARVPALVMIPGDPTQPYCERDEASPHSAHVVYGDAALSGLLDEYDRLGGREEVRDAQARLVRR